MMGQARAQTLREVSGALFFDKMKSCWGFGGPVNQMNSALSKAGNGHTMLLIFL